MSCLIVGCGYLGRRIGQRLARRGERVFGTARSETRANELAAWGVEPVIADVLDPASLERLPTADRVVYCIGFDRAAGVPMRTVYVDGLRNAMKIFEVRTKRILYVGATSVYGRNDGGWVDEGSPTEPITESGRVCLEAETVLARGDDLERVVVRFSGLYGPGRIPRRAALERGEPVVGDPEKFLNLIQIDDAASAAVAALDGGAPGRVYLATDDHPLRRRDYYAKAAALLGAPAPQFVTPEPGSPEARREEANKRVANRRIKAELGVALTYPHAFEGLAASVDANPSGPVGS